ncbi:MAG: PepSY-like domain-containing protein [Bacteroidetes bacterium]|nr:PepSY-like domain-containing protein [Bacteroidota bacterium]
MKKLSLMMVGAMITSLTFAQKMQEEAVPSQVKNAFHKQFPNIMKVKWEKEEENFEASYHMNKIDHSAVFDAQGHLLETEVEIETNQLPNEVLDYMKTNYKDQLIKEAAKITDGKNIITFEVEIKGMDLLFESNGKFIKEIKN